MLLRLHVLNFELATLDEEFLPAAVGRLALVDDLLHLVHVRLGLARLLVVGVGAGGRRRVGRGRAAERRRGRRHLLDLVVVAEERRRVHLGVRGQRAAGTGLGRRRPAVGVGRRRRPAIRLGLGRSHERHHIRLLDAIVTREA